MNNQELIASLEEVEKLREAIRVQSSWAQSARNEARKQEAKVKEAREVLAHARAELAEWSDVARARQLKLEKMLQSLDVFRQRGIGIPKAVA